MRGVWLISVASHYLIDLTYFILFRHFLFESQDSRVQISSQLSSLNLIQNIVRGIPSAFRFPSDCTFVLTSLDFKLSSIQDVTGMSLINENALGGEEEEKRDD